MQLKFLGKVVTIHCTLSPKLGVNKIKFYGFDALKIIFKFMNLKVLYARIKLVSLFLLERYCVCVCLCMLCVCVCVCVCVCELTVASSNDFL